MKVLLLSPFFYPEPISTGKYNTALAEALADTGASVEVITSHPFYPDWKPVLSNAELRQISIIRGGVGVRYPSRMILRRLVLEIWYSCHVCWTVLRTHSDPHIVVGIFPPNLFFCLVPAILHHGVRKVGIVHDFQATLGVKGDGIVTRCLRWLIRAVEAKSFRSCDTLIVLSKAMEQGTIRDYGARPERVVVAYPFVSLQPLSGKKNLEAILPPAFQHVVYSGALGRKQNPLALVQFFRAAASRLPNVRFHIFSEGPIFHELHKNAEDMDGRVLFHSLVAPEDLQELYARSTVQIIPQLEGSEGACLPSKLPNILATGCAVFAICASGSELAEVVRGCSGLSVPSWDTNVLAGELEHFLERVRGQTHKERREIAAPILSEQFSLGCLVKAVLNVDEDKVSETGKSC